MRCFGLLAPALKRMRGLGSFNPDLASLHCLHIAGPTLAYRPWCPLVAICLKRGAYTIGRRKFLATAQNQRSTDWGRGPAGVHHRPLSTQAHSGFMPIMQLIYTLDYGLQVDFVQIVSRCVDSRLLFKTLASRSGSSLFAGLSACA